MMQILCQIKPTSFSNETIEIRIQKKTENLIDLSTLVHNRDLIC